MRYSILAIALAVGSCGQLPDVRPVSEDDAPSRGVELRLVDAPSDEVQQIVVTVRSVSAQVGTTGWTDLANQRATIDLLQLQNGTFAQLGVAQLPTGQLTQIRLITDESGPNFVVTPDGKQHPLTIPSGPESGIKLQVGVAVPPCARGSITLDLDGKRSIFTHPTGTDQWILRPVVRLQSIELASSDCSAAADGGVIADGGDGTASGGDLSGAVNSPPLYSGAPTDCGGVQCGVASYCYNGACTSDGIIMY